jgi:hypothetical protein
MMWLYFWIPSLLALNPAACIPYMLHRQDGDFSEPRFREIVNAALANNLGNMLNRTLNLLHKNCGGEVRERCLTWCPPCLSAVIGNWLPVPTA